VDQASPGLPPYVPYWNPHSVAEWQAQTRPAMQNNEFLNYAGRIIPGQGQYPMGMADPGWQMLQSLGLAPATSVGL
jgi:hypothetical protein